MGHREWCYRESPVSTKLADGMACSTPVEEALDVIWREVSRIGVVLTGGNVDSKVFSSVLGSR